MYNFNDEDLADLAYLCTSKQFNILSFAIVGNRTLSEGAIGEFVPIAVMHPEKKDEVIRDNKEITRKLARAFE